MSKRRPKTIGLEWLYHSMTAFNGSGYADKATPESYVASYKAYKTWKKEQNAIQILEEYPQEAHSVASKMVNAREAGHTPSAKNQAKFESYYSLERMGLL
jgi:hypothetical protein